MGRTENRPDLSRYLAHFTTNRKPCVSDGTNSMTEFVKGKSALSRLINILDEGKLRSSQLPWVNQPAVCFTECPWQSLLAHSRRYSSYAVGFTKPHVFAAGGGPAYYVRADHYRKQEWAQHVRVFVTPFWPKYRPTDKQTPRDLKGKTVDFSHEREWRVPHDFTFKLEDVMFVLVERYEDVAQFPKNLKDAIGRERFLMLDVYRQIESLWPVHLL